MFTKVKKFIIEYRAVIITLLFSVLFVSICFYLTDLDIHPNGKSTMPNIDKINSASLIVLTFFIVCVAWIQLEKLKEISQNDLKVTKSDFLLRIINHFSDKSIIQALEIIHRIRLESEDENGQTSDKLTSFIAKKIRDIRDDPNNINEYLLLKNFLDYLEHIAYLCKENYVSTTDIENCIGGRIVDYYNYFKDLINYFESNPSKNTGEIYKYLKILVNRLNTQQ